MLIWERYENIRGSAVINIIYGTKKGETYVHLFVLDDYISFLNNSITCSLVASLGLPG